MIPNALLGKPREILVDTGHPCKLNSKGGLNHNQCILESQARFVKISDYLSRPHVWREDTLEPGMREARVRIGNLRQILPATQ